MENYIYFFCSHVRGKTGNFMVGLGNLKSQGKSGNSEINGCGILQKTYLFCFLPHLGLLLKERICRGANSFLKE